VIIRWDSAGNFERSFGRPGQGPGELAGHPFPTPHYSGRIHVTDGGGWWHVFDDEFNLLRTVQGRSLGPFPEFRVLLDDERFLVAYSRVARAAAGAVALVDREGRIVRAIGASSVPNGSTINAALASQPLGYSGGATFWTIQTYAGGGHYRIEKWDTSGALLLALDRRAAWLPQTAEHELQVRSSAANLPPQMVREPSVLFSLHLDAAGFLVVVARVQRSIIHVDVLAPYSRLVVASEVVTGPEAELVSFFRRTRLAYRQVEADTGRTFQILRYEINSR
jgi:hypothetical protein